MRRAGTFLVCVLLAVRGWSDVSVDAVAIPVTDMERAVAFYRDVLSFHTVADREVTGSEYEHLFGVFGARIRSVRMQLGDEAIELTEFMTPRGRPMPTDTRGNDGWFEHVAIIVRDMDRAYAHLRDHRVQHASTAPQRLPDWNPNAGGIAAFYFRDPEGNFLEILSFPPGKGAAKWHRQTDELFLGIDHTAIVVADTEKSLGHYRDALGMKVVGTSENWGDEQERLNNVFGAHLRITALRGNAGFGIELLEYLAPRTGRPYPADTLANDAWHWQIRLNADDANTLRSVLDERAIVTPNAELGFDRAFLARDPDRHANLFMYTKR